MKIHMLWSAIVFAAVGACFVQAADRPSGDEKPHEQKLEPFGREPGVTAGNYQWELDQKAAADETAAAARFRHRHPGGYLLLPKPTPPVPGQLPGDLGGPVGTPAVDRLTTLSQGIGRLPRISPPGGKLQVHWPYDEPATAQEAMAAKSYARTEKATTLMADRTVRYEESPIPAIARGRFQVAIVGFEVNRWTRDDLLENDGRGDEVFLHAAVHHLTRTGTSAAFYHTAQYGDINRGGLLRIRAGSQGDAGGLTSGDNVGSRRLPAGFPADGFREFRLPLLVFDGELSEVEGAVMIAPSAWEFDDWGLAPGTGGDFRFGDYHVDPFAEENRASIYERGFASTRRRDAITRRLADVLAEQPTAGSAPTIIAGPGVYHGVWGDSGGNRPIGMTYVEGESWWQPSALGLNYFTADYISRTDFDGARGVVSIRYRDADWLCGDYTIHLQVRRLD